MPDFFKMGPLPFCDTHHKILTIFLFIPGWFFICPSVFGLCLVGDSIQGPFAQESSALTTIQKYQNLSMAIRFKDAGCVGLGSTRSHFYLIPSKHNLV